MSRFQKTTQSVIRDLIVNKVISPSSDRAIMQEIDLMIKKKA